eukprot:CAMPEP_0194279628 /NCGR_PEP_ID=MMETSP0169-20130528/14040_1 /TAXON_ID=218684 /ORGANISM="Corethron pennatum, Strain L29A3" /LENGTH=51 /DNA_ID=CAMNT_0039024077 /DNA_START=35 /DNA_END=187 /DNA_ORIENTATION=-
MTAILRPSRRGHAAIHFRRGHGEGRGLAAALLFSALLLAARHSHALAPDAR